MSEMTCRLTDPTVFYNKKQKFSQEKLKFALNHPEDEELHIKLELVRDPAARSRNKKAGNSPLIRIMVKNQCRYPAIKIYIHLEAQGHESTLGFSNKCLYISGPIPPGKGYAVVVSPGKNIKSKGNRNPHHQDFISEYCYALQNTTRGTRKIYRNCRLKIFKEINTRFSMNGSDAGPSPEKTHPGSQPRMTAEDISLPVKTGNYIMNHSGVEFAGRMSLLDFEPQPYEEDTKLSLRIINLANAMVSNIYLRLILLDTGGSYAKIDRQIFETIEPLGTLRYTPSEISPYKKARVIQCSCLIRRGLDTWKLSINSLNRTVELEQLDFRTRKYVKVCDEEKMIEIFNSFYFRAEESPSQPASTSSGSEKADDTAKANQQQKPDSKKKKKKKKKSGNSQNTQSGTGRQAGGRSLNDQPPQVITELQILQENLKIVKSSHNHVTLNHPVQDVRVLMQVFTKNRTQKEVLYHAHYCEKCKCYFDFGYSFESQLKLLGIPAFAVMTKVSDHRGIPWLSQIDQANLQEEHILHYYGYRAGKTKGLPDVMRSLSSRHTN